MTSPVSDASKAPEPPVPTAPAPDVPAAVRAPVGLAFSALAAAFRRPAFHPRGVVLRGVLVPHGPGAADLPFVRAGSQPVVGRLSKAVGLPAGVPDLYGLGLRLPDVYGPGRHQDLLVTSCGRTRRTRRVLAPTRGFDRRPYSTVLAYDTPAGRVLLGAAYAGPSRATPLRLDAVAEEARRGGVRFLLGVARTDGRWRAAALVTLDEPVSGEEQERFALNPWNTAAALRPAGVVNRLRHPAYVASERTRPGPES